MPSWLGFLAKAVPTCSFVNPGTSTGTGARVIAPIIELSRAVSICSSTIKAAERLMGVFPHFVWSMEESFHITFQGSRLYPTWLDM